VLAFGHGHLELHEANNEKTKPAYNVCHGLAASSQKTIDRFKVNFLMAAIEIDQETRLALRARAHHVETVVLIGNGGISAAILKEIDRALTAHELIKVRVPGTDRIERDDASARIASEVSAARVTVIGKTLVLFRPSPQEPSDPQLQQQSKPRRAATERTRSAKTSTKSRSVRRS
jgi:RNA-binding protein